MATETDIKVGMRLLDEVEEKIKQQLGDRVAMPFGSEYNADHDIFAKDMIKQCELAEAKFGDHQPGLARSHFLKGRLYGFYYQHGPMAYRAGHKRAVSAYEKALELGFDEATARYYLAILYGVGLSKDNAIQNFEKVIEIAGADSKIGLECAKEIEKLKAKKAGCFIATAAYGSYLAPEVLVFRRFRDETLLTSKFGGFSVEGYYSLSPFFARIISKNRFLRAVTRYLLLEPLLRLLKIRRRFQ